MLDGLKHRGLSGPDGPEDQYLLALAQAAFESCNDPGTPNRHCRTGHLASTRASQLVGSEWVFISTPPIA
jgi:hypothetical protein